MYKVMLVEDEPPIMRMVKAAIESADADFVVTKSCINGKSAVEALEKEDFDIILTDIKMPVMSGIELAKWVNANKPDTMVILLSGYRDFDYARKALEYKVFDYLLKPVSRDKVKELTVRIKQELKKSAKTEPSRDEEKSTVVILACAGAYLLYGSNVTLPGERFWTDDKISDFMDSTLYDNEEYVFFNTNVQSERFVVVGTEDSARQELIVKSLFDTLTDDKLPVTLLYKTNVKFKDAGKCFASMREQLINKLILASSQLICCNTNTEVF
jgi:YesN/AraC family two-component response regulator